MKAILRFIIIALVVALGLAMIGVLYLFFIPNATLFGIDYISLNEAKYSNAYNSATIDTIDLSSRGYTVKVVATDSDNISAKVYANTLGFVKKKSSEVKINGQITGGVLDLDISEPHGWAWKGNSYIELYVPQNKSFDLKLNNNSAKTYISNANTNIENFTYTTNSGYLYISNATINKDINLNLQKAKCYIEDNAKLNKNDITLSFTSGDLIAPNMNFAIVQINKNKSGTININSCDSITAKVNAGGRYTIGTAGIVDIVSQDTNVEIGTITEGCSITLTKSGKVNINNINCAAANIVTNTGKIAIENANESVILKSDEGDITIKNATKLVTIDNKYGNINITFKSDIAGYDSTTTYRSAKITNYNGKVNVVGVENIDLTIGNKGRANIEMRDVKKENVISGNIGDISVVVNKDAKFNLSAGGTTGSIRVNFNDTIHSGGYTESNIPEIVPVNGGSEENKLTITNKKGDIKVVDTVLAG